MRCRVCTRVRARYADNPASGMGVSVSVLIVVLGACWRAGAEAVEGRADTGRVGGCAYRSSELWSGILMGDEERKSSRSSSGGENDHTSMIVLPPLAAMMTAFSSSKTTRHTASAGELSSRTSVPFLRSQTLTRPSDPPLTMRVLSNCRLVTLLSCAANR